MLHICNKCIRTNSVFLKHIKRGSVFKYQKFGQQGKAIHFCMISWSLLSYFDYHRLSSPLFHPSSKNINSLRKPSLSEFRLHFK